MRQANLRYAVTFVAALSGIAAPTLVVAPPAAASIGPTMSLNQSAGKTAGSTANLGLDLKFNETGTDSPHNLTINLPPGLLANASINGGSCLKTTNVSGSACQVGSGTVTAKADPIPPLLQLPVPLSVPVSFYLVPPPAPGDLAGLAVEGLGMQIGSTGEIKIRPSGDPAGVGVKLVLALPDQLPLTLPIVGSVPLAQISVDEINSTFDSLRYPATCPSTPANVTASVDSYSDATVHTVTAPLSVTGCSSLPYAPKFNVTAVRDSADRQVKLGTTVTQTAAQAPSRSVSLAFPTATLAPNVASIKALCLNLASGTCPTVGSVTATSPLYPTPLSGKAYLTGSSSGLSLTLVFPSPFPLTLSGAVDLVKNSATFSGLPDIPLTNLGVTLSGGAQGLFLSTCQTPSGTAKATLTDQNADKTVTAPASFSVSGCPGFGGGGSGGGGGGAGAPGDGSSSGNGGNGSTSKGVTVGGTNLSSGKLSGLATGHAALSFRLAVARHAAKIRALTVELPRGLRFVGHRLRGKLTVSGVSLTGARIKSLSLARGHLVITLRSAVRRLTVHLGAGSLSESSALRSTIKRLRSLLVTVIAENTAGKRTTIRVQIHNLGV